MSPRNLRSHFLRWDDFAEPDRIYQGLRGRGPSILLESGANGRYSLIGADPYLIFQAKADRSWWRSAAGKSGLATGDPLRVLENMLRREAADLGERPGPVPFSAGAFGFFGYDLKKWIEPTAASSPPDQEGLPDIYLLFLDRGVVVDHAERAVWLFAPTRKDAERIRAALARRPARKSQARLAAGEPQSLMSRETFERMVLRAKEYIRRGDIFQANLSQRFRASIEGDPYGVYAALRRLNPSAYFGYLDAGFFQILSGSPERLVRLKDRVLETRPIAGTSSRGRTPGQDRSKTLELLLSAKERAEHVMLVDLERNDMGRVAETGSVVVNELMTVEDYSHVKHIVSNVRGILRDGLGAVDVLRAFFPGGTITGAPKVRAMQIIDELEPVARGPYTGSFGYLGFDGGLDLNILIRSLVVRGRGAYLQTGAGIVADSDPGKEYDETLYKAEAVLTAVYGRSRAGAFFERCRRPGRVGSRRHILL